MSIEEAKAGILRSLVRCQEKNILSHYLKGKDAYRILASLKSHSVDTLERIAHVIETYEHHRKQLDMWDIDTEIRIANELYSGTSIRTIKELKSAIECHELIPFYYKGKRISLGERSYGKLCALCGLDSSQCKAELTKRTNEKRSQRTEETKRRRVASAVAVLESYGFKVTLE